VQKFIYSMDLLILCKNYLYKTTVKYDRFTVQSYYQNYLSFFCGFNIYDKKLLQLILILAFSDILADSLANIAQIKHS